jgi:hypothetical protein
MADRWSVVAAYDRIVDVARGRALGAIAAMVDRFERGVRLM